MVTFYSTNCPKCKVIETKLKKKNIEYTVVDDVDTMVKKGIKSAPYLEVGNELMDFVTANTWLNNQ